MSLTNLEIITGCLLVVSELLPLITRVAPNGLLHTVLITIETFTNHVQKVKEQSRQAKVKQHQQNEEELLERQRRVLETHTKKENKRKILEDRVKRLETEKNEVLQRLAHQAN